VPGWRKQFLIRCGGFAGYLDKTPPGSSYPELEHEHGPEFACPPGDILFLFFAARKSLGTWIGPTNLLLLAVRLALAMGEVVQRAGSAFHHPPKSISDYLRDMIPW
jgi:hypothetical protein